MGSHIIDDNIPLSVNDESVQDLLWEYAQRRREKDEKFANDLEGALINAGFKPLNRAYREMLVDPSSALIIVRSVIYNVMIRHKPASPGLQLFNQLSAELAIELVNLMKRMRCFPHVNDGDWTSRIITRRDLERAMIKIVKVQLLKMGQWEGALVSNALITEWAFAISELLWDMKQPNELVTAPTEFSTEEPTQ